MTELILFIFGVAIGWYVNSWFSAKAFYEILKDLKVPDDKIMELARRDGSSAALEESAESTTNTVELKIESVQGRLMAYRAEDDFFVAQGDDAAALFEQILNKYPTGSRVEIVEGSDLVIDYLNTKQIG